MVFDQLLDSLEIDPEETLGRFGQQRSILERFLLKFPVDPTMDQLTQSVTNEDPSAFELSAHTLKGVANNLGLSALGRLAARSMDDVRDGAFERAIQHFPEIQDEYARICEIIQNYKQSK